MTLNYKYTILYTFVSLFLFWVIIKYGSYSPFAMIEGLEQIIPYPEDAVINNNDKYSPLYSQTVNLPINDSVSCKNMCGPKNQCSITKEQCSSDIDCQGCNPGPTPQNECITKDVSPNDAAGKLGYQGLTYSPLTTGYNNHNADFAQLYEGSKDVQLTPSYEGVDSWTKTFNLGLQLYNQKRELADKYSEGISQQIIDEEPNMSSSKLSYYEPKYPMTTSATGLFYETTPPASNSAIQ
jgi:hypothetical protein